MSVSKGHSAERDAAVCRDCAYVGYHCGGCGCCAPSAERDVPVRVCCGQRHHGPVCPDGLTVCCICFNRVPKDRLALLEEGDGSSVGSAPIYEDVCKTCRRREEQWGRAHE